MVICRTIVCRCGGERSSKPSMSRPSSAPAIAHKARAASRRTTGQLMGVQHLKDPYEVIDGLHAEGVAEESAAHVEASLVQDSTALCSKAEDQDWLQRRRHSIMQQSFAARAKLEPTRNTLPELEGTLISSETGIESHENALSEQKPPEQLQKRSEQKPPEQLQKRPLSAPAKSRQRVHSPPHSSIGLNESTTSGVMGSGSNTDCFLGDTYEFNLRPQSAVSGRRRFVNTREHREKNVFKQWYQEQSAWTQLSYLQKKMTSEGGMNDLTKKLKNEQQHFLHTTLKDKNQDELYDLRMNFNGQMVAERKRQQERRQQGSKQSCKQSQSPLAATAQYEQALTHQWTSLGGQQWGSIVGVRKASQTKKAVANDLAKTLLLLELL